MTFHLVSTALVYDQHRVIDIDAHNGVLNIKVSRGPAPFWSYAAGLDKSPVWDDRYSSASYGIPVPAGASKIDVLRIAVKKLRQLNSRPSLALRAYWRLQENAEKLAA